MHCNKIVSKEGKFMYNTYPNPQYNPQYNPFNYNPIQQQKMDIVKVNGENGARAFQMPPNSNTLLLDESAPIVWLAQTDGAGYKTVTPYTITPYKPEPPVDVKSLEERISKLEGMINAKSNASNAFETANTAEYKTDDVRH
jgi:hypothetical protein